MCDAVVELIIYNKIPDKDLRRKKQERVKREVHKKYGEYKIIINNTGFFGNSN